MRHSECYLMPGTLYLVATPIGNLEDITFRAVRVLGEVQLVAAEDTRRTATLLRHYEIRTPTISLHDHNERARTPRLVARILEGDSIALLSDAGTPLVSDPGLHLVRQCINVGISVVPIPGPSAVLSALTASGAPMNTFVYLGFPPRRSNDLKRWCSTLAQEERTAVFFESPHRLLTTLTVMKTTLSGTTVSLCREMTKAHEELVSGPIETILDSVGTPRGEYTCVVWPCNHRVAVTPAMPDGPALLSELGLLTKKGFSRRAAVKDMARRYGMSSRNLYQALESAKLVANGKPPALFRR